MGARGWRHAQWNDGFYPGDLPAAWRLDYYLNEFPLLLVEHAELGEIGEAATREQPPVLLLAWRDPRSWPALENLPSGVGGCVRALVGSAPPGPLPVYPWPSAREGGRSVLVYPGAGSPPGAALLWCREGSGARDWRASLEPDAGGCRVTPGYAVLDASPPSLATLRELQLLSQLLGE